MIQKKPEPKKVPELKNQLKKQVQENQDQENQVQEKEQEKEKEKNHQEKNHLEKNPQEKKQEVKKAQVKSHQVKNHQNPQVKKNQVNPTTHQQMIKKSKQAFLITSRQRILVPDPSIRNTKEFHHQTFQLTLMISS